MCDSANVRDLDAVDRYRFTECGRCGFIFAPGITAEDMVSRYTAGYHGPEDGAPERGWANTAFLEPALARLPDDERLEVLDFGAGQSRVADVLRERGHRVVAVDIVPPVRPHPDRLTGTVSGCGFAADRFDLVYAFQVFEHLPDPRPHLFELLRVCRPGGYVLIHTDMETREREPGFTRWWYVLPPDHCSFFRHRTFEVALDETPHGLLERRAKSVLIEAGAD